jgi:hypothetical protein
MIILGRNVLVSRPGRVPWHVGVVVKVHTKDSVDVYVYPTNESPGEVVLKAYNESAEDLDRGSEPGWRLLPMPMPEPKKAISPSEVPSMVGRDCHCSVCETYRAHGLFDPATGFGRCGGGK